MLLQAQKATNLLLKSKKETNMFLILCERNIYIFTMMTSILQQLKKRRLELGLKQKDMMLRMGISRQQYQQLESNGNPRLGTLELIVKGLNSELMLIPKEKIGIVMAALEKTKNSQQKNLLTDPWKDLLGDN